MPLCSSGISKVNWGRMTHISAAAAEMPLLKGWGLKSRVRLNQNSSLESHTIQIYHNNQIIRHTAPAILQFYARMRRSGSAGESASSSRLMVCGVINKGRLGVSLSNLVWMHLWIPMGSRSHVTPPLIATAPLTYML